MTARVSLHSRATTQDLKPSDRTAPSHVSPETRQHFDTSKYIMFNGARHRNAYAQSSRPQSRLPERGWDSSANISMRSRSWNTTTLGECQVLLGHSLQKPALSHHSAAHYLDWKTKLHWRHCSKARERRTNLRHLHTLSRGDAQLCVLTLRTMSPPPPLFSDGQTSSSYLYLRNVSQNGFETAKCEGRCTYRFLHFLLIF